MHYRVYTPQRSPHMPMRGCNESDGRENAWVMPQGRVVSLALVLAVLRGAAVHVIARKDGHRARARAPRRRRRGRRSRRTPRVPWGRNCLSTKSATGILPGGLPIPTRMRLKSRLPSLSMMERRPLCPACPPPDLYAHVALGDVELVVDERAPPRDVPCRWRRAWRGDPPLVFIKLWGLASTTSRLPPLLVGVVNLDDGHFGAKLVFPVRDACLARELVDGSEARVVPRRRIFFSRVAESGDHAYLSRLRCCHEVPSLVYQLFQ